MYLRPTHWRFKVWLTISSGPLCDAQHMCRAIWRHTPGLSAVLKMSCTQSHCCSPSTAVGRERWTCMVFCIACLQPHQGAQATAASAYIGGDGGGGGAGMDQCRRYCTRSLTNYLARRRLEWLHEREYRVLSRCVRLRPILDAISERDRHLSLPTRALLPHKMRPLPVQSMITSDFPSRRKENGAFSIVVTRTLHSNVIRGGR
jgi:hypothetical protein